MNIILRKIHGRFDACWQSTGMPNVRTAGASPGLSVGGLGGLSRAMFALILMLGALAAIMAFGHAPTLASAHGSLGVAGVAVAGTTEVKELFGQLQTAFSEFKDANNERIKQIEAKGTADPLLLAKVEKANKDISDLDAKLDEQMRAIKAVENAQARVSTIAGSGEGAQKERDSVRRFLSMIRNQPLRKVTVTDADVEQMREYSNEFENHLRTAQINNTLSVGSSPEGGFWVAPDLSGRMIQKVFETSPMRQIASEQTIGTDALEGPNDQDEAGSNGWVGEQDTRTAESTTPVVGKWRIPVAESWAMPKTTQKNLDDNQYDVESWLLGKVSDKLSRVENAAVVNGDGVVKPRGFMTYPSGTSAGQINQLKTGVNGGFAASLPGNKLIDLVFSVKDKYRNNAKFAMHRLTVAEIRKLVDGQGNYLWQRDFQSERGGTVLGYGIAELNDMAPVVATVASLSIAFGDFKEAYQIVNRQGIRIIRDNITQKGYVLFYTTRRTGGDVLNFEAIGILNFST